MIATVGLDKKKVIQRSFCIPYKAPFSSLAFCDDGHTLAAGTTIGHLRFYNFCTKPQYFIFLHVYANLM